MNLKKFITELTLKSSNPYVTLNKEMVDHGTVLLILTHLLFLRLFATATLLTTLCR